MNGKKKILAVALVVLLASVVVWYLANNVLVDFRPYPRQARQLDLRGQEISISHYEALREKLPECEILWDVPFQGELLPQDITELTVAELSQADTRTIALCFPKLRTLRAESCTDYDNLLLLKQLRPGVKVNYRVLLDDTAYVQGALRITLGGITEQELALLPYLPLVKTVTLESGSGENLDRLLQYCDAGGISVRLKLAGEEVSREVRDLTLKAVAEEELSLLEFLPKLERLHLVKPKASAESLLELKERRGEVQITWEQEICGKLFSTAEEHTEIDLSDTEIRSLDLVERGMAYFPDAKQVFLGLCGIDDEAISRFRERSRDKYKVVWTVRCGKKLTARTDDRSFMPLREGLYYFNDAEAYNLRYCEEMVCIDIGHMSIHNIDFVSFMPNLEYLILAHTQIQYIEPIRSCKKLKFLELDWSPIRDLSPLVDCTGLEDLNIGNTGVNIEPLKQMPWLKNLWMIYKDGAWKLKPYLPDTRIVSAGEATVASGWRNLPNYYAMRDELGMYYMSW